MNDKGFTNKHDSEANTLLVAEPKHAAIIRPSSFELGEYHLGLLSEEKTVQVEQYLKEFPYAQTELNLLQAYLNEPDVEPSASTTESSTISQLKVLLAKLTGRTWALPNSHTLQLMPSGLRGLEEGVYEVDDIYITLGIRDDEEKVGYKVLTGIIDAEAENKIANALLWRAHSPTIIATTAVEDSYEFEFSRLEPGDYELILTGPNLEVHIPDIAF